MSKPTREHGESESLGLEHSPGGPHYRAYVGPPSDYDLIAAMTFNLITTLGLRQHHRVLDIGCGSLRIGRLLIPYLNAGNYVGIEPNAWLIEEGRQRETGDDQIRIKNPEFIISDRPEALGETPRFDFAVAQSIFSHCGLDLIDGWLAASAGCLRPPGALIATAIIADQDFDGRGWIYPQVVSYTRKTLDEVAGRRGLRLEMLDWRHPRQVWLLFAMPEFDSSWILQRGLSWNARMDSEP